MQFHNKVKMMTVFFKIAGVNAEYFMVLVSFLFSSADSQNYARKRIQHEFEGRTDKSVLSGVSALLVLHNFDDRVVIWIL